mmetsp:Transcript_95478/g.275076  ORF Transcript_95478/g.275076 Transcript_95478/m.275076 type:complete len:262 (+) Transcript_95478:424-1209(+)
MQCLESVHELLDVDTTVAVGVQHVDHQLHVLEADVEGLELIPNSMHGPRGLLLRDETILVLIDVVQKTQEVADHRLPVALRLRHEYVPVALGDLNGAVHENAGNDVQHGEQHTKNVQQEQQEENAADGAKRVRDFAPTHPAGHRFEEGVHRAEQTAVSALHLFEQHGVDIAVSKVRRALREDNRSNVKDCQQHAKEPDQGHEGMADERHHHTELAEEAQHPQDPQEPRHSQNLQQAAHRGVGHAFALPVGGVHEEHDEVEH